MDTTASRPQFSLSELEEAGLLSCTDYQASELLQPQSALRLTGRSSQDAAAKETQHGTHVVRTEQGRSEPSQDSVDYLLHHIRPQLGLTVNTKPDTMAHPQRQLTSSASGEHSAKSRLETEFDRKQASNREHQRRFRQRQKVRLVLLSNAVEKLARASLPSLADE